MSSLINEIFSRGRYSFKIININRYLVFGNGYYYIECRKGNPIDMVTGLATLFYIMDEDIKGRTHGPLIETDSDRQESTNKYFLEAEEFILTEI